jgi:hypothetical protein
MNIEDNNDSLQYFIAKSIFIDSLKACYYAYDPIQIYTKENEMH